MKIFKKKSALDRFRDFWRGLNFKETQEMWGILTALRGPDDGTFDLKYFTTASIRSMVFDGVLSKEGYSVWDITGAFGCKPDDSEETLKVGRKALSECESEHFIKHFKWALNALMRQDKKVVRKFRGARDEK